MAFETLRLSDLMEGAHNCCINYGNVKKGEKVLIVTDTKTDFRRVEAVACVCREVGAEVTTMIMKAAEIPNQEPPSTVAEAMKAADIVIAPLFITISHTKARNACVAAGARYLGMYAYDVEELACEGARFPAEIVFRVTQIVRDQWLKGRKITVTCDKGSKLSAEMKPEYVVGWEGCIGPLGTYHKAGTWLERFGNFAGGFGVVGVWPQWTSEGVIYFDAAHTIRGRLKTPLKFVVKKGRVVEFEGDADVVDFFKGIVKKFGKDANHIGELMIGTNAKARLHLDDVAHVEAHRRAGTLHCAMGNSIDNDMQVFPGVHLDQLMITPSVYIDDEPCVVNGKLLAYQLPEIQELCHKHGWSV